MNSSRSKILLDQGDPVADPRSFRRCLGQFATGVAIITTGTSDQGRAGVTVNSFASLSLEPPLILWSIGRNSRSFETFLHASHFAVNILGADQIALSRHFASSSDDKFESVELSTGASVAPLLAGAVAHLECSVEAVHDGGDHVILVGRVGRFSRYEGNALLFAQGQYGLAGPHPDLITDKTSPEATPEISPTDDLTTLVFDARNRLSSRFDQQRALEGIGLGEGRVLRRVEQEPGIDTTRLLALTFLGERDLADVIAELSLKGWLRCVNGDFELTTEGKLKRKAIRDRWQQFHAEQMLGIAGPDIQTASSVLGRIIAKE